jgi:hypothetical protein
VNTDDNKRSILQCVVCNHPEWCTDGREVNMKQLISDSTDHIIVDIDGRRMLVDTGAAISFNDEYHGVHVDDLSRLTGVPLDGVLGMKSLQGKVISLTRNTINLDATSPEDNGVPMQYISGIPCVDVRINGMPCCAAVKTGATTTYLSEALLSRDKFTRVVDDIHPLYGKFNVKKYVNYFSIGNKNYFADAAALPDGFSMLSSTPIDAIIGTDVLNRFGLILDFADHRLYLVNV